MEDQGADPSATVMWLAEIQDYVRVGGPTAGE